MEEFKIILSKWFPFFKIAFTQLNAYNNCIELYINDELYPDYYYNTLFKEWLILGKGYKNFKEWIIALFNDYINEF